MMMMNSNSTPTAALLETTLREQLAPSYVEVLDESAAHAGHAGANGLGYGTHFRIRIAGAAFAGKSRVAAHRLVYDALQIWITAGVHALAIEILPIPKHPS
jgi:BolA family transcriptional regulator, general stress-responsive regulator